jgi:hypothetical protein
MKTNLPEEDYAAFKDFHREVLRARAEEQERQGGPPLTEMTLAELDKWLQEFHAEARRLAQRESDRQDHRSG